MKSWRIVPTVVLIVCVALLAGLAVLSQGYPVRKLDLNDSGVWITNDTQRLFGRVNKSAGGLDAWLDAPGGGNKRQLEILQDGGAVVELDLAAKVLIPVDSAGVKNLVDASLQLPGGALVDMRGGTLAVLDPDKGAVYAVRYDPKQPLTSLHALDFKEGALVELGAAPAGANRRAALSVSSSGTIQAILGNGKAIKIQALPAGFAEPVVSNFAGSGSYQVAAIGEQAAYYDAEKGTLILPDGKPKQIDQDPAGLIQQGGPESDSFLVATSSKLIRVRLKDAMATEIAKGVSGLPAAPVRLLDCDFGAWAGATGAVVRSCGTDQAEPLSALTESGALTRPIFRINRNQLVLNDAADGRAFDLATQNRMDQWDKIKPKPNKNSQNPNQQIKPSAQEAKPVANPDEVGVRPGRVTIGHLLDNDTDALGQVLMITRVDGVPDDASVKIAPDGQSVVITPPKDSTIFGFRYTISNGVNTSTSNVRVTPINLKDNKAPAIRPGYKVPEYVVASFGTLPLSVLGDWRDPDGDSLTLVAAEIDGQPVPVTPEGRIEFVAGREDTKVVRTLKYTITDGLIKKPITHELPVTILEAKSLVGTPPVTFPDAVRGVVGKPVAFNPLGNDIPGSDPRTPDARMRLGAEIRPEGGLSVSSNVTSGQVTAIAQAPGSYELTYTAAFGSSTMQTGKIRLDIYPDDSKLTPVAVPDSVTLRGPTSIRLDPTANDADPLGGLLTITSINANTDQLDVAVVSGRWVLITAKVAHLSPHPAVVRYTISNGSATATGDIIVTQLPELPDAPPIVKDDLAIVRSGDSALVNVLANDVAQNGETLKLVTNTIDTPTVGELTVFDPSGGATDATGLGRAFIFNNQIRYVAPKGLTAQRQVVVEYQAESPNGTRSATGKVLITIKPEPTTPEENRAPTPSGLEVRLVAGETVKISLPTSSQDPDGDTVVVTGLVTPPKLGRIRGQSPTSITYEAFPNVETFGTDTFTILVADQWGKTSPAQVRVGITPPGQALPPVAIDDNVTVAPGALLRVDAIANDLYSRTDSVQFTPLESLNDKLPAGVSLQSETGPIVMQAPGANSQPMLLSYALRGNGGIGIPASVKVVAQEGYKIPPVIFDEVAKAEGTSASVNVLQRAWDPDGADDALKVTLLGGPAAATVAGGKVTVPLSERIQFVPYQVTDGSGATSAGVVFVPSSGAAAPHLKSGGLIELGQNTSVELKISDYVYSPRERNIEFAPGADVQFASPDGKLDVEITGKTSFKVTSKADYIGPGSVTLRVMDGSSLTQEGVLSAYVTIPVQVGPGTPVLRCPEHTVTLIAGGKDSTLDIATLCRVWSPNPDQIPTMSFSGKWEGGSISGVTVEEGHILTLRASGSALPDARGVLMIGVSGTNAVKMPINVIVKAAGPPTMRSRTFNDIKQGTPVQVPLGIESPLRDAKPRVLSITKLSGPEATYQVNGTTVTITPGANVHGHLVFGVMATDVDDPERADRHVRATITMSVYGKPDKPGVPVPGQRAQSKAESLTWTIPANNNAPITQYEVEDSKGKRHKCASNSCRITGLANGVPIKFRVRALNKADWSDPSDWSKEITPDQPPPAPTGLKISNPQDRKVTLSWNKVIVDGTAVHTHHVLIDGRVIQVPGSATSVVVPMPSNNSAYEIGLVAENKYDKGPMTKITGQSAGKPLGLKPPTVTPARMTGANTAVRITWNMPDKNGPNDLSFRLTRGGKVICTTLTTSCTETLVFDGTTHTYTLTATNGAGGAEHSASVTSSWTAVGTPDTPRAPTVSATGADRTLRVTGTTAASRDKQATLRIFANGTQVFSGAVGTAGGQAINQTIVAGANGSPVSVTLQMCNELRCSPMSSAGSATPYGPIKDLAITDAGSNGTNVSYRVSVNPNGKPVTVKVNARTWQTGTGPWSTTITETLGYSATRDYSASSSDGTRNAGPVKVTLKTGPKPLPQASVTLIGGPYRKGPDCTTTYCKEIHVQTSGFTSNVRCNFSTHRWEPSGWTQGGSAYKDTGMIYGHPYDTARVTCTNGSQTATGVKEPWGT